jgi:hypothetical protein
MQLTGIEHFKEIIDRKEIQDCADISEMEPMRESVQ